MEWELDLDTLLKPNEAQSTPAEPTHKGVN